MSSSDRPATKAFKDRWNSLLAFWEERRRGLYDRDFTAWRIDMGLTPRTARESYWDAGETLGYIRIVFEKRQKFWEFCGVVQHEGETAIEYMHRKTAEKKPKLSAKAADFFKKCRIKEKMRAGPCAHECPFSEDADCRECTTYRSLRNKDFLKEGEENNL